MLFLFFLIIYSYLYFFKSDEGQVYCDASAWGSAGKQDAATGLLRLDTPEPINAVYSGYYMDFAVAGGNEVQD